MNSWLAPSSCAVRWSAQAVLREALQALVQCERAKRLAALGGSDPALNPVPRRRSAP